MDHTRNIFQEHKITFVERRHEYGSVYTYVWKPIEPVLFMAGQYVHVRLEGLPEGVKAVREFSFASAPHDPEIWFGVDQHSESSYQKKLQELVFGESATLFKIKGHLSWPLQTDVVMIAGGVGVTPFRSILRDAQRKSLMIDATLLHISNQNYLYEKDFYTLPVTYIKGARTNLEVELAKIVIQKPDAIYQVAGSPLFVQTIVGYLHAKGITNIESDEFKGLMETMHIA
ncbi:FAD-dependent oxidoreductase [Patescibacteria group bacterium]|nr:MAG: FAD-dependent oxidoreductase [Patescibacteria group bacterium]